MAIAHCFPFYRIRLFNTIEYLLTLLIQSYIPIPDICFSYYIFVFIVLLEILLGVRPNFDQKANPGAKAATGSLTRLLHNVLHATKL